MSTKSGCVVFTLGIALYLTAADTTRSVGPAQANSRIASSATAKGPGAALTAVRAVTAAPGTAAGDTAAPGAPAADGHGSRAAGGKPSAATPMPQWLKTVLLAVGLFIGTAFLSEPVLTASRRRRRTAPQSARVVVADYDRLVVTHSESDGTAYVLRPPGEDPGTILRVARLVLPEGSYKALAAELGVPPVGR